ncbi:MULTISPECIES: hypothetical protein [Pseudomonas]|uniref:Uncharacterized protein n=1 Tax=Pseudomonas syringae TaxID=317 RepID=A0A085V4J3_PSESX|nr:MULTISPECIES: hypothetical protein [Pseudomonas]EPJ75531.1 hypothetical protein CFII64_29209 [Pseudomonas sp. CFII64]KFE50356.1 hypothetical protein IV02_17330 [Pseudomonas syringae]
MGMVDRYANMPQVIIKPRLEDPSLKKASADTNRILLEIGEDPVALNTLSMEQNKLRPLFKDFDAEQVSPEELGNVGKQLLAFGLIDNLTADLMGRAALEFDKDGKISHPDVKINALEFFAKRIDEMQTKVLTGDKYSKLLLPDYIKTVHVMKNLQVFASTGDTYGTMALNKRIKNGEKIKDEHLPAKLKSKV